jgi:hypothetical protein
MAQFPEEQTKAGAFKRQEDAFRDWVKRDGSSAYKPERGRYHLYVSFACPWAHRTIILRKLKGLESAIGMTVVDPVRDERGWAFRDGPGHSEDPINGFKFLSEAYYATDPNYRGRVTVPASYAAILVGLRHRLGLSQQQLAAKVGAAGKAVIYQWESRKRKPSPVFWLRIERLKRLRTITPSDRPPVNGQRGPPIP